MPLTIENHANCCVIYFLSTKAVKATEIHHETSEFYGKKIMNDRMVQKSVKAFKNGHTNVHDVEQIEQPSVITEYWVQKVDKKLKENRCFII